jgi:hypothetical protein
LGFSTTNQLGKYFAKAITVRSETKLEKERKKLAIQPPFLGGTDPRPLK